jgi:hypothetical protein
MTEDPVQKAPKTDFNYELNAVAHSLLLLCAVRLQKSYGDPT